MAGPHTTALAALLLQANHSLTVDQLEQIITDTATPRTDSQISRHLLITVTVTALLMPLMLWVCTRRDWHSIRQSGYGRI